LSVAKLLKKRVWMVLYKALFKTFFGFGVFIFYISSMNRFRHFIEWHVFGVCSAIGEKMGVATSTIRKYFIYISFLTMGSPVIFYLFIAFWMNIKNYIFNARRNPLRYL
jgi:phage shock protein PspC (stress-responsive transcriptional regulator)